MPIRIVALDGPKTRLLLDFCIDCGCDTFALKANADDPRMSEVLEPLTSIGTPEVVRRVTCIKGRLDRTTVGTLAQAFPGGLLPAIGSQREASLAIRRAEEPFGTVQMEAGLSGRSVVLSYANDLQAEALFRLGIRFQVSPGRPDLRPKEGWLDYGPDNLYLHAPTDLSLDPRQFDGKRWAGSSETYGHDWYNCLDNEYIQRWWTAKHDDALRKAVHEQLWAWEPPTETLTALAPAAEIARWKAEDWRCQRWVWYNILRNYAIARAKELRLTKGIFPEPAWSHCQLCGHTFHQSRLRRKWLSQDQASVCPICFDEAIWGSPRSFTRDEMLQYLRALAEAIEGIPNSDFGQESGDYVGLSASQVTEVLRLRRDHPALAQVKEVFGSWFVALVAANVLPEGSQQLARGTRCIARDGHVCLSLGEKTICDILHRHAIPHEREVRYPGTSPSRADWAIGPTKLIEFFGLAGDPEYDARIKAKKQIAAEHGLHLIALYPKDLADRTRLMKKLGIGNPRSGRGTA